MKFRIGSPVSGDNFFQRPLVISSLRNALGRDHVSFLAPRRTGKTSVLIHLEETAPGNHPHFRINLEKCTRPDQMISTLLKPFSEQNSRWKKSLGTVWDGVSKLDFKIGPAGIGFEKAGKDWQKPAEAFLTTLLNHDGPITFLLDEFPILVDAAAKEDHKNCEAMLRWFREWRQRTADTDIRFLVTGSIGLDNVVRRHGLADTVNDFDSIGLPPLTEDQAIEFISKLADGEGLTLSKTQAAQMLDLLGNAYPYFIQIFVAEIHDRYQPSESITSDLIEQVYHERMVSGPRNKYLPHMWDRLGQSLNEQELRMAQAVLRAVVRSKDGLSGEQIAEAARSALPQTEDLDSSTLGYVIEVLKHDGYLQQDLKAPHRTRFFSNLLRDYWLRRHA